MSAAHQQTVTHRDLKPDNVMVSKDGRVKVLDFGLAKMKAGFVDDTSDTAARVSHARTMAVQILGTTAYMSPEQTEGHAIDHRSDIFSLGIILHEMITGQRPFSGGSHASIISSILRDAAPPITDLNPALPPRLATIVQRCLAKDPSQRYQTTLDLRNELDDLRRNLQSNPTLSIVVPARRRAYLLPASVIAGLAVLAGVTYSLRSESEVRPSVGSLGEATFTQLTHEVMNVGRSR